MKRRVMILVALLALVATGYVCSQFPRTLDLTYPGGTSAKGIELVGHIGGEPDYSRAGHVQIQGNYAYLGTGSELTILDISDPTHPTRTGYWVLPDVIQDVVIADRYAYVAAFQGGLHIIDISNPARPKQAGTYSKEATSLAVANGLVYVADWRELRVIDVSNPVSPTEISSYHTGNETKGIAIAGQYAFVANGRKGLRILDVSDPRALTEAGSYSIDGYAVSVAISGSHAYVADPFNGLWVLDISNPAAPTRMGFYKTWVANSVTIVGHYVYLGEQAGLRVVDISNPAAPTEIGLSPTPAVVQSIASTGDLACVVDINSDLHTFNIANPAAPTHVGFYKTVGKINSVAAVGDCLRSR